MAELHREEHKPKIKKEEERRTRNVQKRKGEKEIHNYINKSMEVAPAIALASGAHGHVAIGVHEPLVVHWR